MEDIDLGKKSNCCAEVCAPTPKGEDTVHYPSLYIDGDEGCDLPDSGVMTVRFKVQSRSTHERGGSKTGNVCLDIEKIVSVEADPGVVPSSRKNREKDLEDMAEEEDEDYGKSS